MFTYKEMVKRAEDNMPWEDYRYLSKFRKVDEEIKHEFILFIYLFYLSLRHINKKRLKFLMDNL